MLLLISGQRTGKVRCGRQLAVSLVAGRIPQANSWDEQDRHIWCLKRLFLVGKAVCGDWTVYETLVGDRRVLASGLRGRSPGAFVSVRKFEILWVWLLAFEAIGTPFGYHTFKAGFSSDFVMKLGSRPRGAPGWLIG